MFSNNLEVDCDSEPKDGQFMCKGKRGKTEGKVLMRASKDGFSILKQSGDVTIVNELIQHMEAKGKIRTKDDF